MHQCSFNSYSGKLDIDSSVEDICCVIGWLYLTNTKLKDKISIENFYNEGINALSDEFHVRDYIGWKQRGRQGTSSPSSSSTAAGASSASSACQDINSSIMDTITSSSTYLSKNNFQNFFFSDFSFLFSATTKRNILLAESRIQQQSIQQRVAIMGGLPYFVLPVSRERLLDSALHQIQNVSNIQLKMPLKVVFVGEEGIDEGK